MMSASFDRLTDAVARSHEYGHGHAGPREQETKTHFTIALAREAGTPGTTVARTVGERLHWPVYDQELVERVAQELRQRPDRLKAVDERHRSWLVEIAEAFGSPHGLTQSGYVYHLVRSLQELAAQGDCVIVGRGATMLLPRATTLRVRLVGERADRVATTRARLGLTQLEAERWVDETDRARAQFVQEHFHKDVRDPVLYDLFLNTSRWSVAECADFILEGLRRLEGRPRPTTTGEPGALGPLTPAAPD
jgi:cytidylate kinase